MRRKGIAMITYPKAGRIFMERFDLKRILFKTPLQNIGAIRVKEKLGIRWIGEEAVSFGIIQDDTLAKVFELRGQKPRFWFKLSKSKTCPKKCSVKRLRPVDAGLDAQLALILSADRWPQSRWRA